MATCLYVLNHNGDIGKINHTMIVLVPKAKTPTSVTKYRPINLPNVLYKIIAKMVANHLKRVLPAVIYEEQSVFIPGSQILDNAMVAFVIMHTIGKRKSGDDYLIERTLDMSMVCNRVVWFFAQNMMRATVSYFVFFNGLCMV